ncbi:MAG: SMC-Scp complex subunit ScpB [Gemmatimonadota bacterium]|nr:SMC-Scp complex subunit ScpB [Gemmatimonadota bacterium]
MNDARIVEAILFASEAPLSPGDIARADEALDEDRVEAALAALREEYDRSGRAFELREVADGVQLMTRPEFAPYLERFDTVPRSTRLSGPALEALAIVAYRQPISRLEVEYIRGVNSTGVLRTLLDRELILGVGRGEGVGRPVLYGTTPRFMEHFGLASLDDLPRPEELPVVLREPEPLEAAEAPESGEPGASSGQRAADVEADAEAAQGSRAGDAPSDPETALAAVLDHASGRREASDEAG